MITAQGRNITGAVWRPATILDGVPQPLTGTPAAAAVQSWNAARSCTNLSTGPSTSLTTMRGETVPFVAPPAPPTHHDDSRNRHRRRHDHDHRTAGERLVGQHRVGHHSHHSCHDHDDPSRPDHHLPDRQRGGDPKRAPFRYGSSIFDQVWGCSLKASSPGMRR